MTTEQYIAVVLAIIGLPTTIVVFLRSCFALDEFLPKQLSHVAHRILDDTIDTKSALMFFLSHFDMLFRSSSSARPSFWRCAGFSCLVFFGITCSWVILSAVFSTENWDQFIEFFFHSKDDWLVPITPFENIYLTLIFIISLNVIGDYFSLWETRIILEKIRRGRSLKYVVLYCILDILLTITIIISSIILGLLVLYFSRVLFHSLRIGEIPWYDIVRIPVELLTAKEILLFSEPESIVLSICIYTSFSTTLWAGLSVIAMKLWTTLRLANLFPNARQRPFGALSAVVLGLLIILVTVYWALS